MDVESKTDMAEPTTPEPTDVVAGTGRRNVGGDIQEAMESGRGEPASDLRGAGEPPVRNPAADPPERSADDGDTGAPAG